MRRWRSLQEPVAGGECLLCRARDSLSPGVVVPLTKYVAQLRHSASLGGVSAWPGIPSPGREVLGGRLGRRSSEGQSVDLSGEAVWRNPEQAQPGLGGKAGRRTEPGRTCGASCGCEGPVHPVRDTHEHCARSPLYRTGPAEEDASSAARSSHPSSLIVDDSFHAVK